jgi:hypothetical protein
VAVVIDRLRHEDHIDVAHVVELAAPALAEADHGEPAGSGIGRLLGDRYGEPSGEHGGRDVGELRGDVLGLQPLAEITAGHVENGPAVGDPQRGHPLGARVRGAFAEPHPPRRVVRVGAHGREHLLFQRLRRRPDGAVVRVVEHGPVGRMGSEVVGQAGARAEHCEEPRPERT